MAIHDTSISREQATVTLKDGQFILADKGSRFGTYLKITKALNLEVNQPLAVQVGRSILEFTAKPPAPTLMPLKMPQLRTPRTPPKSQPATSKWISASLANPVQALRMTFSPVWETEAVGCWKDLPPQDRHRQKN